MHSSICLLVFFPPIRSGRRYTVIKCALLAFVILASVSAGYGVTLGSRFTYEPVVYAVEDNQIVFSTNHSATAWVEIDGEKYYDLFAGSMKSEDTVHKIIVPQYKLDEDQELKNSLYAVKAVSNQI